MNLKRLLRKALTTLCLSMLGVLVFAQGHSVSGTVTDAAGGPVIGANVSIVGTYTGTTTDAKGVYTINAVPAGARLLFSYIGCVSQTITVGTQTQINIKFIEDATKLDDVVVIGYGTVRKRDLTGAVASVSSEVLTKFPVANVEQALQGRLPGVSVVSQDGRPGAEVSIKIRGGGSVTQSNNPLYIVDGFPTSSISDIPADIIESIDVLKDASSTAIYGARGANGVILVTTKSAGKEKISVSYNGYVQWKSASNTLDVLNAQDYMKYWWGYTSAYSSSNAASFAKYYGLGSENGNHYADYANMSTHNYTNDVLRTSMTNNHNVTVSGGGENTRMIFNTNYMNDNGIRINSGLERLSISLKVQQKLLKNLKFDLDLRYVDTEQSGNEGNPMNGRGTILSSAYMFLPIDKPLGGVDFTEVSSGFGNGDMYIDRTKGTPVDLINDVTNIINRNMLRGSAAITWDIIDGLTARTELGLGRSNSQNNYYENWLTQKKKYGKITKSDNNNMRSTTTLNYQFKGLGDKHRLSLLVGNEVLRSAANTSYMEGSGFPDSFDYSRTMGLLAMAENDRVFLNNIGTPETTVSFFGRANYSFLDRYLLTATFRADGSSKFAPNKTWAYFPAAAFAWRISDESFMAGAKNWLDNLKLRLSYGTSGSDNISSSLWKETWVAKVETINGVPTTVYKPEGLYPNPNLKWESTISRNLGVDFGFWNNRLYGSIDVYWDTTKDLLMRIPYDQTSGYSYYYDNIGETSNKGFELSLGADIVRNDKFRLTFNTTYNYNKNNIDKLKDGVTTLYGTQWASTTTSPNYDYTFSKGRSVGLIRAYVSDGFYTTDDFTYSNGVYTLKPNVGNMPKIDKGYGSYPNPFNKPDGDAFPGAMKLRDADGDGNADIQEFEVSPKHTGGFNISANYKNFDLGASFNWVLGGNIYNVNALINSYGNVSNSIGANRLNMVNDAYKYYDVNSSGALVTVTDPEGLKKLNANARYYSTFSGYGVTTSDFIEDGSYLRLQNLTLGYTLPKSITKKVGVQRLRIYVTGSNLFTLTGYSGMDPEVNAVANRTANNAANVGGFPTPGLDFGTYPRARTFTFGINLDF